MSLGAFAQGFGNGMNMGRQWKKWAEEDELKKVQAESFAKVDNPEAIEASGAYIKNEDGSYQIKPELMTKDAAPGLDATFRPTTERDALRDYTRTAQSKGLMSGMDAMKLNREARQDEFSEMQMAEARRKNQMEQGLADAKKYFSEQTENANQFVQGIRGIGGLRGLQDAVKQSGGTLSPEAMRLYRQAMYEARPENAIPNAASKLKAYDPVGTNTLTSSMLKQAKEAMLGEAGRFVQAGDFEGLAGFVSDNSNYSDGFEYKYLGALPNGKLRFAQVADGGKVIGTQDFGDKAEVLAYMQSTIDPEKAVAYWDKKKDNERADRNASITAGSAALNNRLTGMKIDQAELQAERDNAIHDLRVTLSKTKDPEQRESIQQQITDLVRVKPEGESHQYEFKVIEDMMGNKSIVRANKKTGDVVPVYYQDALRAGQSGSGKNSVFTPPPGMNALPAPQKPVAAKAPSFEEYAAQIRAKNPGVPISDDVLRAEYNKRAGG